MPSSPSPFPIPPQLTADEMAFLDAVLEDGSGMIENFEMLDGFLAALVTGPELLMPSQYLPYLLGGPDGQGTRAAPLADLAQAEQFLRLLMQHWNVQVTTFMEGRPWSLVVDLDSPQTGRDWALGFSLGAELQNGWEGLSNISEILLGAVALLANEGTGRGKAKARRIAEEDREVMLDAIAHGLPRLYAETRPGARKPRRRPVKRAPRKPGKRGRG